MDVYIPHKVEPQYEEIKFDDCNINAIKVDLSSSEYAIAEYAAQNMWANKKRGNYGRGLVNTDTDPYKVERTGRLGEIAFAKIMNTPLDVSYIEGGDHYDFVINKLKYDVKTRCQKYSQQVGIVYAYSESGIEISLSSDIYVFAFLENEHLMEKTVTVYLVGYCDQTTLKEFGLRKARRGRHFNYEAPFKNLQPMSNLI